jgi:hypothetical protein
MKGLWGTIDTVNIGSHAPACPRIYIALRERGPLPRNRQAPPIRTREEILRANIS